LRCPTCQSQSVKESEAGLSLNMKIKIREMLKEGKSRDEILQFFQERYGEWILRSPQKRGFNLLLWLLPGIIILTAVLMLYISIKHRSGLIETEELAPLSKKEEARIQEDLNKLNQEL
ncbi:cytochrome c-type biogenesis protein CcmH, partial [bacterium]|nr:cytochrome c-type biogenesis protein CcmH [bacterium]